MIKYNLKSMKVKIILIFLIGVILSGCATVYNPATGREELIFIDTPQEVAIGNRVAYQVERQYRISQDPALNERLNIIGKNIAQVCERQDVKYRFFVIREKEINAFSIPGGYVYVNSGLMEKNSDDELAGVLAHEIAHVAARHSIKKMQAVMGYNLLMSLAFSHSEAVEVERTVGIAMNLVSLGYEREDEKEADRLAVRYTYKAGYDPYAIITMLEKLQKLEREDPLSTVVFLRSHPPAKERISIVEQELANLSIPQEGIKRMPNSEGIQPKEKFCPECGEYYPNKSSFCIKDGTKLKYTK
ncbi:MAG: hypothetical protein FJZ16_07480 [Candidatus Omnitrophica bacterium]|nr:hypothetical protein [Candidatus Omnitrophota bacterium]